MVILKDGCCHWRCIHRKVDGRTVYFYDTCYGPKHKYSLSHFRKIWKSRERPDKAVRRLIAIKKL